MVQFQFAQAIQKKMDDALKSLTCFVKDCLEFLCIFQMYFNNCNVKVIISKHK